MKRRRFLQICAGAALAGRPAAASDWRGQAFGADVSLRLAGEAPMAAVLAEIAAIEDTFSLYRESELTRLNATGHGPGSERMRAVLACAARVHAATAGAFDPTVQPLWQALARGTDGAAERASIGLERIDISSEIRLSAGQGLTLNGIVQGYAADCIAALLAETGLTDCLIDMGEYAALGGPYRLGIEDPAAGMLGARTIGAGAPRAMATSSPAALALPGGSHILGPRGEAPRWSTVSVGGDSAMLCDAASTAFVLMDASAIEKARAELGLGAVTLIDFDGNLSVI
ncbi:FAD:protein FMN transferase [Sinirhodobacter ferrireducens]|uniref:FAD:protein FMN transferase n=1 Tax=Paenirhodobacter ferrireducens TaxID=1215032 RepID=A0A443LTE4_9RHOB|nr:FAD:protein FMN transferase [Sinirhodobacter ferrireducens]RWR52412.1 FAD:protein FMN transferase [Sinirhodobacter ferrireducens]